MSHMTESRREPPLYIDMDANEALERFIQTDPKEVEESIKRSKQKKPPVFPNKQGKKAKKTTT